jgi:ubiquitin-like-conjugating enzyme ATG3
VFDDISSEHARKTVTMDAHPHLGVRFAYIHPCRHAEVMKRIMDRMREAGKELRVDQYLLLFLKFIAAVIPTIEYDYTMDIQGA